ncbi:MAG: hypothetical protein Roseis2KO_53180 [Roseivirga sp.]
MLYSCGDALTDTDVAPEFLLEAWTHSMEEQEDANSSLRIFRPSDSREFAPSRFRDAYEFMEDGACRYLFLHPADAHEMKEGSYAYNAKDSTIRIFSAEGDFLKAFTVKQLSQDILVMELTE